MLSDHLGLIEVFFKIIFILNLLNASLCNTEAKKENTENLSKVWDLTNVPVELVNFASIEEVLDILAQRKYRSCQASVLFNPLKKSYLIRDPSKKKSKIFHLKDYIPLQCKKFKSRNVSFRDRFFLTNKNIEKIIEYNQDSVLKEGINAFPDVKNGLEVSLFPVKLYTAVQETHYTFTKDHLCYDTMKILGIDEKNNVFLVLIAGNQHRIFSCEGYDISKYIRYTSFCDEFCNEDFVYFSQELVKCRCNFGKYSNSTESDSGSDSSAPPYTNILDKYENFANSHEITLKLYRADTKNKSYQRYYLYILTVIFTLQLLYINSYHSDNPYFLKLSMIFYMLIIILLYVPERLRVDKLQIESIFELISDLCPIGIISYKVLNSRDSEKANNDMIKLSLIVLLNCFNCILRESLANEIELLVRALWIFLTFLQPEDKFLIMFFSFTRIKLIFEFFARLNYFLVDKDLLTDISVPLHVMLGRPRELFQVNEHLLFQINYVKIKQYFSNLYGNWFLEAINFHKVKNMLVFLNFVRYFLLLNILTIFNRISELKKAFEYISTCKFDYLFSWGVHLAYFNIKAAPASTSTILSLFQALVAVSMLYSNVFLTKESIYIFIAHLVFGYIMTLLYENKGKKTYNRNRPRMSGNGLIFSEQDQDNNSENLLLNGN